jgi:hypothetical protein
MPCAKGFEVFTGIIKIIIAGLLPQGYISLQLKKMRENRISSIQFISIRDWLEQGSPFFEKDVLRVKKKSIPIFNKFSY